MAVQGTDILRMIERRIELGTAERGYIFTVPLPHVVLVKTTQKLG